MAAHYSCRPFIGNVEQLEYGAKDLCRNSVNVRLLVVEPASCLPHRNAADNEGCSLGNLKRITE